MIECVEELTTRLKPQSFTQRETPYDTHIDRLHSRSVHRISADIAERVCGRSSKRRRIEPCRRIARSRAKHRLACQVCPHRILAQRSACIRCIAEHRDRQREAGLELDNR